MRNLLVIVSDEHRFDAMGCAYIIERRLCHDR